eukprot:scaffold8047_cov417-Prasinococcus_capsulatus_cf.AAC.10
MPSQSRAVLAVPFSIQRHPADEHDRQQLAANIAYRAPPPCPPTSKRIRAESTWHRVRLAPADVSATARGLGLSKNTLRAKETAPLADSLLRSTCSGHTPHTRHTSPTTMSGRLPCAAEPAGSGPLPQERAAHGATGPRLRCGRASPGRAASIGFPSVGWKRLQRRAAVLPGGWRPPTTCTTSGASCATRCPIGSAGAGEPPHGTKKRDTRTAHPLFSRRAPFHPPGTTGPGPERGDKRGGPSSGRPALRARGGGDAANERASERGAP